MTYTTTGKFSIARDVFRRLVNYYDSSNNQNPFIQFYERPETLRMVGEVTGRNVLDIGCATGWYTKHFATEGASVVGIDIAPEMVECAKRNLGETAVIYEANIDDGIPFIQDSEMDKVVAPLVLHFLEDWTFALSEIRRVLKPGGELIFSVTHPTFTDLPRSKGKKYLCTEIVEEKVNGLTTRRFRRSMSAIINALVQNGFSIMEMTEPAPQPEFENVYKDLYPYFVENPYFLFIKAKKI